MSSKELLAVLCLLELIPDKVKYEVIEHLRSQQDSEDRKSHSAS